MSFFFFSKGQHGHGVSLREADVGAFVAEAFNMNFKYSEDVWQAIRFQAEQHTLIPSMEMNRMKILLGDRKQTREVQIERKNLRIEKGDATSEKRQAVNSFGFRRMTGLFGLQSQVDHCCCCPRGGEVGSMA